MCRGRRSAWFSGTTFLHICSVNGNKNKKHSRKRPLEAIRGEGDRWPLTGACPANQTDVDDDKANTEIWYCY